MAAFLLFAIHAWTLQRALSNKEWLQAVYMLHISDSEVVFDLAIAHFEFAILQIGITNKDVLVTADHTLGF